VRLVPAGGRCPLCGTVERDERPAQSFLSIVRALTMVRLTTESAGRPLMFKGAKA
jgi:hypothetical protein